MASDDVAAANFHQGGVNSPPLGAFSYQANDSETYGSRSLDTPPLWGGVVHSLPLASDRTEM